MKRFCAVLAALCLIHPALAREAAPMAEDPVVEERLVKIAEELRCLVCQNESIAGSQAELAVDLRNEVRDLIKAGKTDRQVKDFLVARYGEFVLYRPQFKPTTYALWIGPFVLLLVGFVALFSYLRKRSRKVEDAPPLTEADRKRAEVLLKESQS
ncbi:MAG: cytochrome c-type biogenesis protein CcmH [Sulfuritalea sp.]|nr:cytochrome c-type biogenesis protein CcmH [Sulfuritalea sp.]